MQLKHQWTYSTSTVFVFSFPSGLNFSLPLSGADPQEAVKRLVEKNAFRFGPRFMKFRQCESDVCFSFHTLTFIRSKLCMFESFFAFRCWWACSWSCNFLIFWHFSRRSKLLSAICYGKLNRNRSNILEVVFWSRRFQVKCPYLLGESISFSQIRRNSLKKKT